MLVRQAHKKSAITLLLVFFRLSFKFLVLSLNHMCAMDVMMYFNCHFIVNGISKSEAKNLMQNIHLG